MLDVSLKKTKVKINLGYEEIIKFETLVDRKSRPFKIPYIDEDWILGHYVSQTNS